MDHWTSSTPREITLSENQAEILAKYSRQNAPSESCAILFGRTDNGQVTVKEIFLTKNIEDSPINFTISNEELIRAYDEAAKKNLDISGIFHSHPDSAPYPSSTDAKYMEINPVPWVIFSNATDKFKAYIYNSGIIQVPVKIV